MLDDRTLAHLRHMVSLSRQQPGDWSDMGPYDPGQEGDDAYRYQLAYMAYGLALAQYHHTPAYRELWKDTIARLIEKMMRWEVWGYWELTSRGSKVLDPDMTELGDGWIDPVVRQNVMYSGHLLAMVSMYEMLYRDGRFDEEGSLTFKFRPVFRGFGPEDFPYDHGRLARAIYSEFERNDFLGCECEPNAVFVYCNQFPLLGFIHYDHTHGTDFAAQTLPKFKDRWAKQTTMFGASPDSDLPIFYRKRQDEFIYEESSENSEGITAVTWASVMHAWLPEYVEMVYPRARDQILRRHDDGTLAVNLTGFYEQYLEYQENPGHHTTDPMMIGVHIFGTLALAAAEVGDVDTLEGLLAFADRRMNPTWKNGGVFYPRNDDLSDPGYVTALVGNALLASARLCPKDGFRDLYERPWDQEVLSRPELCDVDYPSTLVKEAVWTHGGAGLRARLTPGGVGPEWQTLTVANLQTHLAVSAIVDGSIVLTVSPSATSAAVGGVEARLDAESGRVHLGLLLNRERVIEVRPS